MKLGKLPARLKTIDTNRIRGRTLQNIRRRHFATNPLCVMCQAAKPPRVTLAEELDHIIALCNGGKDVDGNRQGLCWACHQVKTAQDMGNAVPDRPLQRRPKKIKAVFDSAGRVVW